MFRGKLGESAPSRTSSDHARPPARPLRRGPAISRNPHPCARARGHAYRACDVRQKACLHDRVYGETSCTGLVMRNSSEHRGGRFVQIGTTHWSAWAFAWATGPTGGKRVAHYKKGSVRGARRTLLRQPSSWYRAVISDATAPAGGFIIAADHRTGHTLGTARGPHKSAGVSLGIQNPAAAAAVIVESGNY